MNAAAAVALFLSTVALADDAKAPTPAALAARKLGEMRELVHQAHLKPAAAPAKKASGLTAEQETRLFGGKAEPAAPVDPSAASYAGAWPRYMTSAEHLRWVDTLRGDKKLRLELRKRIASQPGDAPAEEKEAAGELTALLNEADHQAGEIPKDGGSLKPLSPEDAFDLDQDDVKALERK